MLGRRFTYSWMVLGLVALAAVGVRAQVPTVEQMKSRIASTTLRDRPKLCIQIAQRQMAEADRLYVAAEDEKAGAALTDVVTYTELARDYSIQSHKYQKQAEIAVREMTRKLNELTHTLSQEEQVPVRDAIKRLEKVRDDLLASMFTKGVK